MDKQVTLAAIEAAIKAAKANKLPYCCDVNITIHGVPLKVYQQVLNKYPEFIDDLTLNNAPHRPYPYYSSTVEFGKETRSAVTIFSGRMDNIKDKLENNKRYWQVKIKKMQALMETIDTELEALDSTEEATEKEIAELIPAEDEKKMYF